MRRSSADTKSAIVTAARMRFASHGYDRATIRTIATDAGIDPAMVMRYFGSKQQLFEAAVDADLRLPDLTEVPADGRGAALAGHFVDRWDGDEVLLILLRASATQADVAARVQRMFATQVVPVLRTVSPDPADGGFRAGLVATQILGVALCRYVLKIPPVVSMSRDDIVRWIGPTIQRYLFEPVDGEVRR